MAAIANILIIGAGPAGSAAAILLARRGFQVQLVERASLGETDRSKIGESLPPAVKPLLESLETWETFQGADHLKCYGNKSFWGNDKASYTDFISQPPGYGWHIDRSAFEQMLLKKAQSKGVIVAANTNLREACWEQDHWRVEWKTKEGNTIQKSFDFIIDASGRHSWLARQQGVDRLYEDSQLALVTFLQSRQPPSAAASLIETVADGWWYSANIPNNKMATAFLCKPNKTQRAQWLTETGWWRLLQQAPQTLDRLLQADCHWSHPPRFVSADSSILERTYGAGWVAIGDAAMTYDPIASHGIMMALVSARDASQAIADLFAGQTDALAQYHQIMSAAYYQYVQQREKYYQAERRFVGEGYW